MSKPKTFNAIVYVWNAEPICISGIVKTNAKDWADTAIEKELAARGIKCEDIHALDIFPA